MKTKTVKNNTRRLATGSAAGPQSKPWGLAALACLASFIVILVFYWPALNGRFVFDDMSLPFALPSRDYPLRAWPIVLRPVLTISYWMNYHLWGAGPYSFHFVNLLIHAFNTVLVGLVLVRLLGKAG